MLGTAGLPHVIIRFYTVRKASEARISAGWALLFIAILYTTAPAVAVFARTNLLKTVRYEQNGELRDVKYEDVPTWFKNWEATGLIEFNDLNGDGAIQYRGPKSDVENELTIDRDIMVLANPEIAKLPNWVVGLVAAGGLAAALSTAAGLLLVISTAVAHDLLKGALVPTLQEKQELVAARIAAGVAVCIAGYFGINPPGFVAQVVAFAFGLAASSFFPAIVMGIFSKRMNKAGAVSGMIVWHHVLQRHTSFIFQIYQSGTQYIGALAMGHFARGDRNSRHGAKLHSVYWCRCPDTTPTGRGAGTR